MKNRLLRRFQPLTQTLTMKKYITILLLLATGYALHAEDLTSQAIALQPMSSMEQDDSSMRVITQNEFDGTEPITIHVGQVFIIPLHYERTNLCNNVQVYFGPDKPSIMSVSSGGLAWSGQGKILDMNLICTGLQKGDVTVVFGEETAIHKEIKIQVIE